MREIEEAHGGNGEREGIAGRRVRSAYEGEFRARDQRSDLELEIAAVGRVDQETT